MTPIQFSDFKPEHTAEAAALALANYEEERRAVPALPLPGAFPDLRALADNGLGTAAFIDGRIAGFLCCEDPFADAYHTTGVPGVFSPIHAHAARAENRALLYSLLYQHAGEKWVRAGAVNHAISLYAHDREALGSFFNNGFGCRCLDALRPLAPTGTRPPKGVRFRELPRSEWARLTALENGLRAHLAAAPAFMPYPPRRPEEMARGGPDVRFFAAERSGEPIAYIKICGSGETFLCSAPGMQNICGAYCLPPERGTGLFPALLGWVSDTLHHEGNTRLGVDCESTNPTALRFWGKSFNFYTRSVVRRVDEKSVAYRAGAAAEPSARDGAGCCAKGAGPEQGESL